MKVSKSKRFEIFARYSFTCQYCGRRPPEVVLELDHIHPQSRGGNNDDLNLTTSCEDCNRGKSAKVLGEIAPKPDADLKYLSSQQEIVEIRRYLDSQNELESTRDELIGQFNDLWGELVSERFHPDRQQWMRWLGVFTAEEIDKAIRRTGIKSGTGCFGGSPEWGVVQAVRYASGVLHKSRAESRIQ